MFIELNVLTFSYLKFLFFFCFYHPLCMCYILYFSIPLSNSLVISTLTFGCACFFRLFLNLCKLHRSQIRTPFTNRRPCFCVNSLWHNCSNGWPNGAMMDEEDGVRKPATVDGFLFHMIDAATCYKGRQLTVTFLYSNINPLSRLITNYNTDLRYKCFEYYFSRWRIKAVTVCCLRNDSQNIFGIIPMQGVLHWYLGINSEAQTTRVNSFWNEGS